MSYCPEHSNDAKQVPHCGDCTEGGGDGHGRRVSGGHQQGRIGQHCQGRHYKNRTISELQNRNREPNHTPQFEKILCNFLLSVVNDMTDL